MQTPQVPVGAWLNELNESWDEGVLYSEANRGYGPLGITSFLFEQPQTLD